MGASEKSRLKAEEAGLTRAIDLARVDLDRTRSKRAAFVEAISKLSKSIARLEAKGPRVVGLVEYRRMRVEVTRTYRDLGALESDIRSKEANIRRLCRDLKETKSQLSKQRT